ncbi:MAG: response regulator [Bacteroidota bacterium]
MHSYIKEKPIVLVVDDDATCLFLATLILHETKLAQRIYTARNGAEALDWLEKRLVDSPLDAACPTLIFLDINMPVMDGFELLETLKDRPDVDMSHTQIILLSSSTHIKDKEKALTYAVSGFLQKPLSKEKLRDLPAIF